MLSLFFDTFYISSLAFFVLGANCKFVHAATFYWMPFPQVPCFNTAHSILFIVGIVMAAAAALIAWLMSLAATELDPDSKNLLAMGNPRWGLVTACTLSPTFLQLCLSRCMQ